MSHAAARASQLRTLFVVYFAVLVAVDVTLGWNATREALRGLPGPGPLALSPGGLLTFILLTLAVLFALGLWLFGALRERRNWARIVLLVVGWLAVLDAVSSLLLTSDPRFYSWLSRLAPGPSWERLVLVDRVKDLAGLVFWGFTIFVLQFDPAFRRDFFAPPPEAAPPALD